MRDFLTRLLCVVFAPNGATRRERQTLGSVVLVAVVLMVILGSIYLEAGASPGTSLLFWGACFLLMLWAVFLAYLNVRSIKEEFRDQRKKLFVKTFSGAEPSRGASDENAGEVRSGEPGERPEADANSV